MLKGRIYVKLYFIVAAAPLLPASCQDVTFPVQVVRANIFPPPAKVGIYGSDFDVGCASSFLHLSRSRLRARNTRVLGAKVVRWGHREADINHRDLYGGREERPGRVAHHNGRYSAPYRPFGSARALGLSPPPPLRLLSVIPSL